MINPRTIAQEIAYADVATQAANLQEKQSELDAESSGLDSLSSALSDFQSAVDALNSDTDGPVTFAATSNNDSATVSANSQAQAGSYSFFVEQLAQGQQTTFSMGDDAFSATGTFELTMGDSTMDIDLSAADQNGDGDGFIDASELVNAINDSDDNPGVSAALVKTDGTTTIMLTSDSTGAQSAFSVSVTGHDTSNDSASAPVATDVSSAQDAIIHLGSATGPEITNSSNTFDDVIPGVTMTFTEVSDSDSDLTTFNISEDSSSSQEKVQTFVDAYNTLIDTVDSLTTHGDDSTSSQEKVQTFVDAYNTLIDTVDSLTTHGDDSTSAGVFAGDAGLSSLANQLDDIAHASYNGVSIVDYGITLDSHGHLQIDSDQFNDEMAKNPDGLTSIFVGDNSMVAQMDDLINTYTDSSNGIITLRQQNIDDQMSKIQDEGDQLTDTYNANYDRYLEEYTNTLVEVYTMKASMAAFA
ncbi:TPA: flagellar filament capping protein FliD [Escherichia coli]|nr:flagellar filament capping protein FliD [Escherichia coli]